MEAKGEASWGQWIVMLTYIELFSEMQFLNPLILDIYNTHTS